MVIDADGVIVAASTAWVRLLSVEHPSELAGQHVLDRDVLCLIDFTAAGNELGEAEREQIPPLLALTSRRPARGLLRVRAPSASRTLDAVATPLWQGGAGRRLAQLLRRGLTRASIARLCQPLRPTLRPRPCRSRVLAGVAGGCGVPPELQPKPGGSVPQPTVSPRAVTLPPGFSLPPRRPRRQPQPLPRVHRRRLRGPPHRRPGHRRWCAEVVDPAG